MKFSPIYIAAAIAIGSSAASAAELNVNDYCDISLAAPARVKDMRPLADGVSYAAVSDDGTRIETFSYKTGKKTGVLFDINTVKGDVKISDFDGYELSDNGRKILLWNNSTQIYRYSFTADYYVYDTFRSTMARVSEGGPQRCATMSHDGRLVAYVRDNNLYISNIEMGTDNAVTKDGEKNRIIYGAPDWGYEEEFGVQNTICWSGDDNLVAFMRFDESNVPTYTFDNYRSFCQENPTGDPYPESYAYKYPLAGYPNSIVSVQTYDLVARITRTMDLGIGETDYIPLLRFDADGNRLMAMKLNRDQNHLELFSVNPKSTVASKILEERSDAWLSPAAYQMVSFEKTGFLIGSERSGWRHLYEYDYNGTLRRQVTKGEFNVTDCYGRNPKTGDIYVQTTYLSPIDRNVAVVGRNGSMKLLHNEPGFESAAFSSNFEYYLRNWSSAQVPNQYTVWTTAGKKLAEIEMNREYAAKYASAPKMEFTKVKNAAGEDMYSYIIKPLNFNENGNYPLLMYQYNGPDSQEVQNRWRMEGIFYLASQGYVVAAVDGRGTGNRSRAWANAVYMHLGEYETADQLAGARELASLPFIDANRIGCFGWSYGGYMTLMELTAENTPMKAGVSMAPVTDWRWYDSIYTERYMRTPAQNEKGYESASAMNRTSRLDVPLLIMSGTSDDNVHFYNTLKYTSKLNFEGKMFDMMAYTGFEHSLRMCNARVQLFRKVAMFLDANLKK